jgi:hypothetical protein
MSLHFEVAIACDLRPDVPQQALDTLQYLLRSEEYAFDDPPSHPWFTGDAWRWFLHCRSAQDASDWVACAGEVGGVLRLAYRYGADGPPTRHTLSIRCYMHDDQFADGVGFLEWLAGLSDTIGLVGYFREKYALHPTLLYFKGGRVYLTEVTRPPREMHTDEPW